MLTFIVLVLLCVLRLCDVTAVAVQNKGDMTDVGLLMRYISELEAKLEDIEKRLKKNEVSMRNNFEVTNNGDDKDKPRLRRHISEGGGTQGLPPDSGLDGAGCVPGTNGCPVTVTPFSVGGSCMLCPNGPRGYPGPTGPPGRDGRDGRDAVAIVTPGIQEAMSPRVTSYNTDNVMNPSNNSGTIFIRWGHHECPMSSVLVYSGVAAGSFRGSTGGGANQLCLPSDPVYDEPVSGVGGYRAFIYAVEYQINSFPALSDRSWHDVPCAVCKAPSRFSQLVVPAKNVCPSTDEWTLEYSGYLMTERSHSSHHRSMFICVDREMRTVDRTHGAPTDSSHALLNLVEARCVATGGGIPCGPYVDGYELTCAVCTQ